MPPALFSNFEMLSLLCVAAAALLCSSTPGHHSVTITCRQLEEDGGSQRSPALWPQAPLLSSMAPRGPREISPKEKHLPN